MRRHAPQNHAGRARGFSPARTQPLGGDFGETLRRPETGPIHMSGGATEQA